MNATHAVGVLACLLAFAPSGGLLHAETRIVVDFGPYASADVGAAGESEVDWLDAETSDDTVCTNCFAAVELRRYLRKLTGQENDFRIVDDDSVPEGELLLVGPAPCNRVTQKFGRRFGINAEDLERLEPEGYYIKTVTVDSRRITLLAGGGRVGTLYAAYDLLYRLGCRWFAPGQRHEEVPQLRHDLRFHFNVCESPDFATRGFHAWQDRASTDFLLWMARNRLNYWCVEQKEHALMRKLGIRMSCGGHDAQNRFLPPYGAYPYDHSRYQGDEGMPPDPYPLSPQYLGDADDDGKLSYFEAHPEWYALVNGRRVPGMRKDRPGFGTNYCTSNSHATDELMKNYVQALVNGEYRDADVVRFWTLDVGKWCQCENCRNLGSPTDRYLLLTHRLDQQIKQARHAGRIHRPIIIRFLVYADVLNPPTRPLPADFDYTSCCATFFPIVRCYVHRFDDPSCSINDHYRTQLLAWTNKADRHYHGSICIGEYYNVSGYRNLPICFMHTMTNDIPYFHRIGARHFHYMHVTTRHWGNKSLTNYQMARQLWDVHLDAEQLWDDYFARRYGPAARTMQRFYEAIETMLANVSELKYGLAPRLNRGAKDLFPTTHLRYGDDPSTRCDGITLMQIVTHAKTCRRLIDQALQSCGQDRFARRIAEDEQLFTYGERTALFYDACAQAFRLVRSGKLREAQSQYNRARHLADLLRQDATSVSYCYTPNDPNALVASRAQGALSKLAKLLVENP